jgi:hypothetical protein
MKPVKRNQPVIRFAVWENTDEIMAQSGLQFRHIGIGACDIKERDEDCRKANPESAIGTESNGTKRIPARKFPHSCTELGESTVCKSLN